MECLYSGARIEGHSQSGFAVDLHGVIKAESQMPDPTAACKSLGTSSPVWLPGVVSALCFEEAMAPEENCSKALHPQPAFWQAQHL